MRRSGGAKIVRKRRREVDVVRSPASNRREQVMQLRQGETTRNSPGEWTSCGTPTRRCVISVAVGHYYESLLRRQDRTIAEHGLPADRGTWRGVYPPGSPPHTPSCPYCFKAYAFKEALTHGYTTILWLDSSIQLLRPLDPLFELIESEGHFIVGGENIGWYSSDEALGTWGITRDEASLIPSTATGVLGLDFTHERSRKFFDRFYAATVDGTVYRVPKRPPADPRYRGNRADETVVGWLAHALGMRECKLCLGDAPGDGWVVDGGGYPNALVRTDK